MRSLLLILVANFTLLAYVGISETNSFREELYKRSDFVVLAEAISTKFEKEMMWRNIYKVQEETTYFKPLVIMKGSSSTPQQTFAVRHYEVLEYPSRSSPPCFVQFHTNSVHILASVDNQKIYVFGKPLYLMFLHEITNTVNGLYEPTSGHERIELSCLEIPPYLGGFANAASSAKGSDNEFKKTSTIKKNSNIPFQSSNLKASATDTERSERSEQLAIPVFRFGSEPALLENGNNSESF